MEQKLPEGNDIYGYSGVSRASLLASLHAAYNLSQEIKEDSETRFEVISLKRAASDLYKTLKEFLEVDSSEQEKRTRFNEFLDALSALIEKTKITHFIVAKNGMSDAEELAKIRTTIAELTCEAAALKEKKDAVISELETMSGAASDIKSNHEAAKSLTAELAKWHTTADKHFLEIDETHSAIEGWDKDIKDCAANFDLLSKQIAEINTTAANGRNKIADHAMEGERAAKELKKTADEHRALLDEIRQTLDGANRVGMAASFKARKDELRLQQTVWQIVFVGAILLIVLAVWKFILPTITADSKKWTELIIELGIVSPLIWLGWFAAKQYGYTSKIREDYAFKAAAAMAYEGHKKAAREVNKELERILLEFSLFNMSQNPIRLYGEGDMHGTPIQETIDHLLKKFPKLRKVSAEVPNMGRFEVEGGKSDETK